LLKTDTTARMTACLPQNLTDGIAQGSSTLKVIWL